MAFLSSVNVIGSGLTAQQQRLDVISENVTNINTTRTEGGGPYRRKMVVLEEENSDSPFRQALDKAMGRRNSAQGGVRVAEIVEDESDFKLSYDPYRGRRTLPAQDGGAGGGKFRFSLPSGAGQGDGPPQFRAGRRARGGDRRG